MKSVAVLLNPEKEHAVELAREIVPWLQDLGARVMVERDGAAAVGDANLSCDEELLVTADFALILGGDGTLLRASRILAPHGVPMLGVRLGQFGFLTDLEPKDTRAALARVLRGDYSTEDRMMLGASLYRDGKCMHSWHALNDVVIAKGPLARMLRLGIEVSGTQISTYSADGLIVASPTGSTAYSLSAGGPLVTPGLNVLIVTPICPHTLSVRSLVVCSSEVVRVDVESDPGDIVMVTIDGQVGEQLQPRDVVEVGEAPFRARLISVDDTNFCSKLQSRLKWGDRFDL